MIRGVPYDAEVEYLESTGTQWIDTGVDCATLDYSIQYAMNGSSSNACAQFGWIHQNAINGTWLAYTGTTAWFGVFKDSYAISASGMHEHVFDMRNGYYIDGTLVYSKTATTGTDSIAGKTLNLFARFNFAEGQIEARAGRSYGLKIYRNGVLVRDFIPVRVGSGSSVVGYMYDRVTRKLFGNQGTGSFVVGPDVARPIMGLHFMKPRYTARDYVQDGLIYHLDAAENIGYGQFSDTTLTWVNLKGGNNATIPSATPLVWSKQGCDFKGRTYGQWISIPAAAFPSTVRTIEWCGACYNSTVYSRMLIDNRSSESNTLYFGLGNNYDQNGAPGNFAAFLGTGNGTSQATFNIKAPAQGVKGTVGVGFSAVNDIRGVVNGVYYTDKPYNTIASMPTFGVGGCMPSPSSIRTCNIVCCGLRVYDRILTAAEVARNYSVDKVRFRLPEVTA